MAGTEG